MNIAIYAGTFDPITYGHVSVIERATKLFKKVIVAVAENQNKKPLFLLDERVRLTQAILQKQNNVEVVGFNTLLLDFAKTHQANVILRGLRSVTDFEYELQLASMNRHLDDKIETMFLMPEEKYMYISSSLVREIAALNGDVSSFVPSVVVNALQKKYQMQKVK